MPILLLHLVNWGIHALVLLIFITSLLSWFQPDPRNPIVKLLHGIVDPVVHPIRAILPPMGGMDFSPLVAILILEFLRKLLVR
jgi:YggT family protein